MVSRRIPPSGHSPSGAGPRSRRPGRAARQPPRSRVPSTLLSRASVKSTPPGRSESLSHSRSCHAGGGRRFRPPPTGYPQLRHEASIRLSPPWTVHSIRVIWTPGGPPRRSMSLRWSRALQVPLAGWCYGRPGGRSSSRRTWLPESGVESTMVSWTARATIVAARFVFVLPHLCNLGKPPTRHQSSISPISGQPPR